MFLTPFFLIFAAAGASVPLLLHLMQNKRTVQAPFPTLRFLKMAEKSSSRKIRLENFLLWLLRTLIMLLLGAAFAMPMIRAAGLAWLGESPRDLAIVIDASYSMGYQTGRGTVWEKAIETANALIEGLTDKDRFCIYLAREQPEALVAEPIGNKQEGLNRLKTIQPGLGSSRLAPALVAALKGLHKTEDRRERELHIITDNQAVPWQSFGAEKPAAGATAPKVVADGTGGVAPVATSEWDPSAIDKQTAVFVTLLGVPAPENAAITGVDLQPAVVHKGTDVKVTATLARSGPLFDTAATIYIDGKEVGRRSIKVGDPDAAAPSFALPPLEVGTHLARIETQDDNLPIDNAFHFLIRVQDQQPALIVGSPDDTLFLRTALRTGFGRPGVLATITPEQIGDKPLAGFSCVYLCNALPLSGQAIAAMEDYVKAGGLLVIFPGIKASAGAYTAWNCLPGTPTAVEELPFSQQNRTLTWDKPGHLLVRPLREGIAVPALAIRRRIGWSKIHETTDRLISMGPDQPFLLDRSFGDGHVLMFAVSADRTWSDFPLSPFYLPLILQCAEYGAGIGAKAPFIWSTDSLPLNDRFPDLKSTAMMTGPDGQPVPIRGALVQGRTVLIAEGLTAPGIYTLATPEQPESKPALAVNIPRGESDLTPILENEVPKRLGVRKAHVATELAALKTLIEEHRVGRTYGEHLLWLALVLIALEFLYSNLLLRGSGPRLSERLKVDSAGHVGGPAARAPSPAPAATANV